MTRFQLRRRFLVEAASAGLALFYEQIARSQSDPIAAATAKLIDGVTQAARRGRPCTLPPGVTTIYPLVLPEGAHLLGARGGSTLRLGYAGPMLSNATPLKALTFEGVTFEGANRPINSAFGLLTFESVAQLRMEDCRVQNSSIALLLRRCGGAVRLSTFENLSSTAIYDENCAGMLIDANVIRRCGDNGIHHWGDKSPRHDGSKISNNVITDIKNLSGGDGLYGNGVRVADCGPVTVDGNSVERCAYSAIRNTGGWDVVVSNNRCKFLNERAMYAEFGFRNASFVNNIIEDCGAGIAATNYLGPGNGDGALITGNVIAKIRPSHPDDEFGPRMGWLSGIQGEGDARILGNRVIGSPWVGILAGFFDARHNVTVEANELIDNVFGVGFAAQGGPGPASIIGNRFRGSKKANIVAMFQTEVISGDLALPGAASAFSNMTISGNILL